MGEELDDGELLSIRAKTATIISTPSGTSLDMRNVSMEPIQQGHPGVGWADRVVYNLNEQDSKHPDAPDTMRKRRIKDKHTWVLVKDILVASKYPPATHQGIVNISRSKMEIASRVSLRSTGPSPTTAIRPSRSAAVSPRAASSGSSASRVRIGRSTT